MAERPLLQIPEAIRNEREKRPPVPVDPNAKIAKPGRDRQSQRLGPQFDRLRNVAAQQSDRASLTLREDPDGIAPERALVFEVAGSLSDFYSQVGRIQGLEFLLEDDADIEPNDDFYTLQTKNGEQVRGDKPIGGRLYMAMPDMQALREILSLWDRYRQGQRMPFGFAPWRDLFDMLSDLRAWGPHDRVLPETLEYWRERVASRPDEPVRFEVEMWFHEHPERRARATADVRTKIIELGGNIVTEALIEPIRYHGILLDLPPDRVHELIEHPDVTLARLDDIMYLRPQSVVAIAEPQEDGEAAPAAVAADSAGDPVAALLDGVPVANHQRLTGRLILDDPDDYASRTPVGKRSHGTSMASLIVHGDLQAQERPLNRPLYVRPVMVYDAAGDSETTPSDRLPLDIVYLAVRRLFEGSAAEPASAPTVVVINLSLGDINRPFSGRISPWARLMDWLAFRYRVLFLISAGNVRSWLPIREFATTADWAAATPQAREEAIINALNSEKAARTILSPAEGINAIAVGAWHADEFAAAPEAFHLKDPFPNGGLPNVSSGVGLGFRQTVKPDLLFDGGRELVRASEDEGHVWLAVDGGGAYAGQMSAAPDAGATGRLNYQRRTVGTSNATALLTRSAVRIFDSLIEAGHQVPRSHAAVLLKALLVHGAAWGDAGDKLDGAFGPAGREWQRHRDNISRFLGYGRPDIDRVLDCAAERATLFAFGDITQDTQDEFDIPLPPSIEGSTEIRRLTITLAWLTPVNTRHQQYRSATLELLPTGDKAYSLAVERLSSQPTHFAISRGTLSHSILEGESAVAFLDGGMLKLRVACRAQAGALDERVPFAVAISIETGVGSGIAVYDEVRAAVQPAVRVAAAG